MSTELVKNILVELRAKLTGVYDVKEILRHVAHTLGESFGADRAVAAVISEDELHTEAWIRIPNITLSIPPLREKKEILGISPELPTLFINDTKRSSLPQQVMDRFLGCEANSFAVVPISLGGKVRGWLEVHFIEKFYRWKKEESVVVEQIAEYAGIFIDSLSPQLPAYPVTLPPLERPPLERSPLEREESDRFVKIAEHGNLIIIRTNKDFIVTEVIGATSKILGISTDELTSNVSVWKRFVDRRDYRRLLIKVQRFKDSRLHISDEIRVWKPGEREPRWILLKGIPRFSETQEFLGWDGFGLDITDKRRTEEQLISERRRIEALYEVARALEVNLGPEEVAGRGLHALVDATRSDAGFACLYDDRTAALEIVSTVGLSENFADLAAKHLQGDGLVRKVIATKQGLVFKDIQVEVEAAQELMRRERLRGAIIVPCTSEDTIVGVIVLYSRRRGKYSLADFDLVAAAASQIGLASRQARNYAHEKRQASALAALYQLTHEVSKHLTPRDVAHHAFPIMQRELACKRMWMGVLNEQGTHIVGQGGFGPGIRGPILNIQIELDLRHDFFDEALRSRQPVIVHQGTPMECSGLNRIIQKLTPGTFVVVPLVSVGRVVGVIVAEPLIPSQFLAQSKIALLQSMANEIATVILARRFEARMAETNKMKMAGLLASGVAHNFNNLLQAIMGQASLLEMQVTKDSPIYASSRMIVTATERGATLIKQLLAFSAQGSNEPKKLSMNELLEESKDIYRSVVGPEIAFELKLATELPLIRGDYSQIQQAITNLLINAKEAMHGKIGGIVKISTAMVRLHSGEVDPDLAPGVYVRVDIEDTGIGMDQERQSRCFEPFYTTKAPDAGTGLGFGGIGLGLSTAYAILKNHDGIITVSSELGEGSTFSLFIPARSVSESVSESDSEEEKIDEEVPPLEQQRGGAAASEAVSQLLVTGRLETGRLEGKKGGGITLVNGSAKSSSSKSIPSERGSGVA